MMRAATFDVARLSSQPSTKLILNVGFVSAAAGKRGEKNKENLRCHRDYLCVTMRTPNPIKILPVKRSSHFPETGHCRNHLPTTPQNKPNRQNMIIIWGINHNTTN